MKKRLCRFCGNELRITFADLGMTPLSNSYITGEELDKKETFYPLHAFVCDKCCLVQVMDVQTPEQIFGEYAYFSSYSDSWLDHCRKFAAFAIEKFNLGKNSHVVEIASNDGYLLQYFRDAGIQVLGIDPASNVALEAEKRGIPTIVDFFGASLADDLVKKGKSADLIIGNNVLAHVPDINDFVSGMKTLLRPYGTITMEFPHLLKLMSGNQFDTIYHEHFSYISLTAAINIFSAHNLRIYDVEEIPTHGGSLRIYACRSDDCRKPGKNLEKVLGDELLAGLTEMEAYERFSEKVIETKFSILKLLIELKQKNKRIAGYGAPAKGNTLLNYCGIRSDFIEYTVDRNPYKKGKYLPGTHIPVFSPDKLKETKPDYVFILPWNLKDEIIEQTSFIRDWGGKFIIPVPEIEVL